MDGPVEQGNREPVGDDAYLALRGIRKRYGDREAVRGIDLSVARGELLCLLGPSGCGKTTTLNLIAGFVELDEGTISVNGKTVERLPPHRRNMGMVFQSYALFPHLNAFENIAFGLRLRSLQRDEIAGKVRNALALTHLEGFERHYPRQLSGGQQQRVALARALVIEPTVLLLDEPFSNLDAKLRQAMREEVREIQQRVGITTIFVTHDQEEALAISDRIAVLCDGAIEDIGTPRAIYDQPRSRFVASFLGDLNEFPGPVFLRPENLRVLSLETETEPAHEVLKGKIEAVSFLGARHRYRIRCDAVVTPLVAESAATNGPAFSIGDDVLVVYDPADATTLQGA
jgi:putative spermidine/putrescine transport system ATP-binding protein